MQSRGPSTCLRLEFDLLTDTEVRGLKIWNYNASLDESFQGGLYRRVPPMANKHVHVLKGLACRKRVAAASSPAAACKQDAALTSRARHACGCARPSRARLCHRSSRVLSDGSKP